MAKVNPTRIGPDEFEEFLRTSPGQSFQIDQGHPNPEGIGRPLSIKVGPKPSKDGSNTWDKYWSISSIKRWIIEVVREVYFAGIFSNLVKRFLKNGRVLEAGCGSAKILERLGKNYIRVGCDFSHNAVEMAKDRCKYTVVCDIKTLPFRDKSFDLIFNQGVMEHFSDTESSNILAEFKRVSGRVLIIVPANTSLFRIYNPFEDTDGSFFTLKRLKKILRENFKSVKVNYMPESFFISMFGYGRG